MAVEKDRKLGNDMLALVLVVSTATWGAEAEVLKEEGLAAVGSWRWASWFSVRAPWWRRWGSSVGKGWWWSNGIEIRDSSLDMI